MSRAEKVAEAHRLRGQGLTHREIGERLGVTRPAVTKWLNPNSREWTRRSNARPGRQEAKNAWGREWNRTHRATCPTCGYEYGIGSARPAAAKTVGSACPHCAHRRGAQIVGWWAEGWTMKRIAAELGWSIGHLGQEMDRLREKGYDLPYRYRLSRPRYEEQAA